MKRIYSPAANERGAVLILALLVMMVLAVFSTVAIMSATQGLKISGKYKIQQQATYASDGGADYGAGLIARVLGNDKKVTGLADASSSYVTINSTDTDGDGITDLEAEIAGLNGDKTTPNPDTANSASPNATVTIMGDTAKIDIDFMERKRMAGSSSEFGSRYEGIGAGSAGGIALTYQIDTYSKVNDSEVTVRAIYKCVEGGGRCL